MLNRFSLPSMPLAIRRAAPFPRSSVAPPLVLGLAAALFSGRAAGRGSVILMAPITESIIFAHATLLPFASLLIGVLTFATLSTPPAPLLAPRLAVAAVLREWLALDSPAKVVVPPSVFQRV
jgi:hypothetical protein